MHGHSQFVQGRTAPARPMFNLERQKIMKHSLLLTTGLIAISLLSSGSSIFAKGNRQGSTGAGFAPSAGHPSGNAPRFYSATAPRFTGRSFIRQNYGKGYSTSRSVTGVAAQRRQTSSRFSERKSAPGNLGVKPAGAPGNWSHNNHSGKSRLDSQTTAKLRDRQGRHDDLGAARDKNREHRKHHHDHDWWRHHCDVIVLVGWGYWGWDAGWWYPAWGYDPYYSSYEYDGPIYGYDGLPPDQVIANVQGALQRLGYYRYAVDGVLGPVTRAALENYQRDHGLSVSGIIDGETLAALGFI